MTDVLTLDPTQHPCAVHSYHSPRPWRTHAHHVIPLAYTRRVGDPEGGTVALCPVAHEQLHMALNAVTAGKPLPRRIDPDLAPILEPAAAYFEDHRDVLAGVRTVAA